MKTFGKILLAAALLVIGAGLALGVERLFFAPGAKTAHESDEKSKEGGGEDEVKAVANVITTGVGITSLQPVVSGFGVLALKPGSVSTISWPADLAIRRIFVIPGQAVTAGTPLVEAQLSPDAALQLSLARQSVDTSAAALETAKARLGMNLATKQEVQAAEAAAGEAQRRLERAQSAQLPEGGLIRAAADAIVQTVRVQAGSVITAGTPLIDLSPPGDLVAQIGFDPAFAGRLTVGAQVHLRPTIAGDAPPFVGQISLISPVVNPATRLIDVNVTLSGKVPLAAGLSVEAALDLPPLSAVVVPREAVLPSDDGEIVFLVREDKAVRTPIKAGLRDRRWVQVLEGVKSGDEVVVLGQSQLENGMSVHTVEEDPDEETP